jgi:hypothetical protein
MARDAAGGGGRVEEAPQGPLMAVRLNGWQRLWVVLSALYLLLVAGVTILLWPTAVTTSHRDEFIARMPAELRANVVGGYSNKWAMEEARKARAGRTSEPRGTTKERNAPPLKPPSVFKLVEAVTFPNGAVLEILAAKEDDIDADVRVGPAYWAIVESTASAERWRMAWQMALLWLVPCATLYALGWSVAWVRRGFRPGPT